MSTDSPFFWDGPLAVFGTRGSYAAIRTELKRLNGLVCQHTDNDLLLLGIEKSGTFVTHLQEIDEPRRPGSAYSGRERT